MNKFPVAGCSLKERDQRLLQMLMSGSDGSRYELHANPTALHQFPTIAIVDTALATSITAYEILRRRNSQVVPVAIVDAETAHGSWTYTVPRTALLRSVFKVLDSIVDSELWHGHRATTDSSQTPQNTAFVEGRQGVPQPLRALVVDDSLAVREQLRAALERMGFHCDQATHADEALELLNRAEYDVALLDVVMPGMTGYELCKRIKHIPAMRTMPVMMLTSQSSPFDRARGLLAGCDTYLTKPITWDEFRTAIDKALLRNANNTRETLMSRGYAIAAL